MAEHSRPRLRAGALFIWNIARLALVLAVLWQGFLLVAARSPLDDLRRADALFLAGRYHDALAAYRGMTAAQPRFALAWVRRGMVETVRGEHDAASRSLATALGLGLRGDDYALARLYQGRVSLRMGLRDEAGQFWGTVGPGSRLLPVRRVLEAESLLRASDVSAAEAAFRAALQPGLPSEWAALAHRRIAALRAGGYPEVALAELDLADAARPGQADTQRWAALVAPLLPSSGPDARVLRAALAAPPEQRPQLLGQIYLDAGLYGLAAAQFDIAVRTPSALGARAFAAYTRLRTGDRAGGLAALERLAAAHPDEPRARALLALAYMAGSDSERARAELTSIRALAPRDPDIHLAWAQWYTAQHDYAAAAGSYRRALDDAPAEQRAGYALALADFHASTEVRLCADGLPAADQAARLLPDDPRALTTLASVSLRCGKTAEARAAAAKALERDPANPAAAYYLGRSLALLGDRTGARRALVSAADLAPDSPWRSRAEQQLTALGL
ncbi:MAG: tetratricopeptide repeat protein [Roseiflexaceae bacterium]